MSISTYFALYSFVCLFFFFFQAEDGIRDLIVTGVQTCALPISRRRRRPRQRARHSAGEQGNGRTGAGRPAVPSQGTPPAVGRGAGRGRRDPRRDRKSVV